MNDLNAYFGFLTEPFSKEMPAKSLFLTEQLKKLFQRLQRLLKRRGIALITGEVGSGKSTAIRAFAENVEKKQIDFVYVDDPTVGMRGIFNSIANHSSFPAPQITASLSPVFAICCLMRSGYGRLSMNLSGSEEVKSASNSDHVPSSIRF